MNHVPVTLAQLSIENRVQTTAVVSEITFTMTVRPVVPQAFLAWSAGLVCVIFTWC